MWIYILYFYLGFLSNDIDDAQDGRVRGRPFLISLYHFQSSPLHIASDRTQTGNLWFPRYVLSIHMEEIAIVVFNR